MTSPYVTFPQQQTSPVHGSAWRVVRVIFAVFALLAGLLGFVMAGFAGIVTWTGCFIECTGGNHRDGGLLMLLAVVLLGAGPAVVAGLYRSRGWLCTAIVAAGLGAVLLALGMSTT